MKIAVVTDDGKSISAHFGRASKYAVYTLQDGRIVGSELRDKMGHQEFHSQKGHHDGAHDHEHGHGMGRHSTQKHRLMFDAIPDCQVVLARGMGQGAFLGLQERGLKAILTDIKDVEQAVQAVADGSISHHEERLH